MEEGRDIVVGLYDHAVRIECPFQRRVRGPSGIHAAVAIHVIAETCQVPRSVEGPGDVLPAGVAAVPEHDEIPCPRDGRGTPAPVPPPPPPPDPPHPPDTPHTRQ